VNPEEGLRMQIEAYRRMTPQQRLQVCFRLYEMTRTLVRQGVKHQNPDGSKEIIEEEVLRRFCLGAGIPYPRRDSPESKG
jgi:hypothetical protein